MLLDIGQFAFWIGFAISMSFYHIKNRRHMMATKAFGNALFSFYYFSVGAMAGGYASAIAGTGSSVQAMTPEKHMKKTILIRNALAVVLAILGIFFCAEKVHDLYPLAGMVIARFVELQSSQQRIRLGFLLPQMLFLAYAYEAGLLLIIVSSSAQLSSNLYAIWRDEQRRKKMVLAPVKI